MPTYEVVEFERSFNLPESCAVVAAQLSERGTRTSSRAQNRALVAYPDGDPSDTDEPERIICGYETNDGPCQRAVDNVEEYCWQHEE